MRLMVRKLVMNSKLLNISSVAAKCGDITAAPAYGTSKGALTTLIRSLDRQLAPYNVHINAIAPMPLSRK